MIKVYVKKEISCQILVGEIKRGLPVFLLKEGFSLDADVSVAIVGTTEMINLANKYLKEEGVIHNVLSFPYSEGGDFTYPPGDITHLGDIVICYPKVVEEAKMEGKPINKKVLELIYHGALHLMGRHHD